MNEESKVTLYNVATFDPNNPNAEEGKLSFASFVKTYSQMYYFQTSKWVECQIEKYLHDELPNAEAFLKIFAWKTNKINQNKSLCEKKIVYTVGEDENKKWRFDKNDRFASAVTRHGPINEEVDKESGKVIKTLYCFLCKVEEKAFKLRNDKEYTELLDKLKKLNKKRFEKLQENSEEIEKEIKETEDDIRKKQQKILDKLTEDSLDGIGSVYLVTFMYFITQGDMPIYDIFAMMALDAIYPSDEHDALSFGSSHSQTLGAYIKPRDLPQKNQAGFENLFSDNGRYNKTYQIYIKKLKRFVEDYNKALPEGQKVTYEKCRDIDRALWVYGHFFQ